MLKFQSDCVSLKQKDDGDDNGDDDDGTYDANLHNGCYMMIK